MDIIGNKDDVNQVGFTVDAGLIQRLGYELVGKAETAVSELIKNSFDADATEVNVEFIDTQETGGTLIIADNGVGMTKKQLIDGFMRISSTDKVNNPISNRYGRTKAGRKGIGRFATQRLGNLLTINTKTKDSAKTLKLTITWDDYKPNVDIASITFLIEELDDLIEIEGTTLYIQGLREKWTLAQIKRVHRYIIDLLQPDFLSDRSKLNNSATQQDNTSFKVLFSQILKGQKTSIANEQISIFDKALAVFEGSINEDHFGFVKVISDNLDINEEFSVNYNYKNEVDANNHDGKALLQKEDRYLDIKDVHFKIYYFIYARTQYYKTGISSLELSGIQELSKTAGGVRLYRNGFRVLPYGEPKDDWTNIDRRWASESGMTNIPLNNKNLFGFVEITDPNGNIFEETASREGLIENDAFLQLSDFINKALIISRRRIAEAITLLKNQEDEAEDSFDKDLDDKSLSTEEKIRALEEIIENEDNESEEAADSDENEEKEKKRKANKKILADIRRELKEASMLRVLAAMGLTIGEFSHEVKQFTPSIYGYIGQLASISLAEKAIAEGLRRNMENLLAYTSYFDTTVSQNLNRETTPIDVLSVLDEFETTIKNDCIRSNIDFQVETYDYDVQTIPMHRSEWSSILFNLYTNSKKAISNKMNCTKGRVLIEVGIEDNFVTIRFHDNGNGIPLEKRSRVFSAFYSTTVPAGFNMTTNEQAVGSGLGLKIVKDIINAYKGKISVVDSIAGYSTCFEICIPQLKIE